MISRHGVDVVQPGNRRTGGLTEWMEIGAITDGFGLEVEKLRTVNGAVLATETPGMGSEMKPDDVRNFKVN